MSCAAIQCLSNVWSLVLLRTLFLSPNGWTTKGGLFIQMTTRVVMVTNCHGFCFYCLSLSSGLLFCIFTFLPLLLNFFLSCFSFLSVILINQNRCKVKCNDRKRTTNLKWKIHSKLEWLTLLIEYFILKYPNSLNTFNINIGWPTFLCLQFEKLE